MYGIRLLLKVLVVPPASLFVLALAGWLIRRRAPRAGRVLLVFAVVGGYLLSTPLVAASLLRILETDAPLGGRPDAGAIVILSGDTMESPEYGGPTVGESTLERIRYGARLQRRFGLPILVTGGPLREGKSVIAELMRDALEQELGAEVRWVEGRSRNTWENARYSKQILDAAGIRRILLVTHAWHMPRSRLSFEAFDLEVIPAPTVFPEPLEIDARMVVPSAEALRDSSRAVQEWIGRLVYRVVYAPPRDQRPRSRAARSRMISSEPPPIAFTRTSR